ncbi:MAG: hypothetical protein M1296_02830, partial [Chloroflexi bacterium]|nr:hypothetical protein [Chloroflexota bacterium]
MRVVAREPNLTKEDAMLSRLSVRRRAFGLSLVAWVIIDSLLVNIAFVLAYIVRYPLEIGGVVDAANWSSLGDWWETQVWFWISMIVLLQLEGVYRSRLRRSLFDQFAAFIRASIVSGALIAALSFVLRPPSQSR